MTEVRGNKEVGSGKVGLPALLLLALTLAVFLPVCRMPFVDWDDALHTYRNPYLQPLTPAHLVRFWRAPYDGVYVPAAYTAYTLLARVAPLTTPAPTPAGDALTNLNPHVFHTANLVLHLLNALLVFGLLRRALRGAPDGRRDAAACGGALLFALHPAQVESVAWISELRGLLSACFGLAALTCYWDGARAQADCLPRSRGRDALGLALFLLALLSKPSAVVVPLLAACLDAGLIGRPPRAWLPTLTAWGVAAAPIVWLTRGAQPVPPALVTALWQRPLIAGDALAFYLSKLLLPLDLAIDYGRTPASVLRHPALALAACAIPVLLALLLWRRRAQIPRVLPVAAGLFLSALLPVLGFVPFIFQVYSTVADRYLYLALLGPALLTAWLLAHCDSPRLRAGYGLFFAACLLLSARQLPVWSSSRALFAHTLAVNPRSAPMHFNLGNMEQAEGESGPALAEYDDALRLDPTFEPAHCNRGRLLAEMGDLKGAMAEWQAALRLRPSDENARANLARAERLPPGSPAPKPLADRPKSVS